MKQTEIGLIPDDWEVNLIGNVSEIFGRIGFRGYTVEDLVDEGFGAITLSPSNIQNGKMDFSNCSYISWKKYDESPEIKIANGDILLVKTGSTYGKSAIVKNLAKKATINPQFVVIKKTKCNNELLGYLIQTPIVQEQIEASIVGGAIPTLSQKQIASFKIPLSKSIKEQQRIAKALSDVDALISTTEKLLQKKKNIKQGAMQELLTGKKRLPGFGPQTKSSVFKQTELGPIPEDWKVKSLDEFIDDFIVPMRDKPTDLTGPIPWCRIEDFDGKYLSESKTNQGVSLETIKKMNLKIFPLNTLLVSCSANLGKCAIVSKELITNQTFIGLVPNKTVNVEYLFYKMSFEESRLNEMATGTTISYLSREQFEKYEITTPPTKEEQFAIAKVLSSMDKEIETLNTKLEKYRNLKTAMMQQLLTGKIRLVK